MKYTFEREALNPINLESEAGLARGDIVSVTISADGAVEVETKQALAADKLTKVIASLEKRNLPRGKKG